MLNRSFFTASLATLLLLHRTLAAPIPEPPAEVYVVLDTPPASQVFLALRDTRPRDEVAAFVRAHQAAVRAQQDAIAARIAALGGETLGRFNRLANALRVRVPQEHLATVAALPGVKRLEPRLRYAMYTDTSVAFVGAPQVWSELPAGGTGEGARIGIIDSGIDYLHADFGGAGSPAEYAANNRAMIEPGTFPTARVVGGHDFVGDAYTGSNTSVPDPDPLDCNGHGTHVAGIAAGQGVLTNRTAYTGTHTNGLPAGLFLVHPGVAPRASLFALKIFGCSGTTEFVIDALEWAVDPNDDGDFNDRLDVLNLSLGSPFGLAREDDLGREAINTLAELGCVTVTSAGNSGNTFYIVGWPATTERAITVANSIDNGSARTGVAVLSPPGLAGTYLAAEAVFSPPIAGLPPVTAEVVQAEPNLACSALLNPASLAGRIALMDRGSCNFTDKILRAQAAGAVAVIMVNNAPGEPFAMGGTPGTPVTIPSVMISQADGTLFKAQLGAPLTVRLSADTTYYLTELADQLEPTSSRGPSGPASRLKPDLAAPGSAILSANVGTGYGRVAKSGTSMAAPHVAGAAALLRQRNPSWPVEDLKAALLNTAHATRDGNGNAYAETLTGAGRMQVLEAVRTRLTAKAADGSGEVSLNFGALELTAPLVLTQQVVLRNFSAEAVTLSVGISNTVTENGCVLTPLASTVLVPGAGTALVSVRLEAHPQLFDRTSDPTTPPTLNGRVRASLFEASGAVWFHGGEVPLRVPYYACLRAGASLAAEVDAVVGAVADSFTVHLPLRGVSAHPQPLVSVFQLGATSTNLPTAGVGRAAADLLAVGAASDAAVRLNFVGTMIYFAIATAGEWNSPSGFQGRFNVEVDTNGDEAADYVLRNSSLGNFNNGLVNSGVANDVFLPVLRRQSNGVLSTNGVANVFSPAVLDTALFNNSVLVLPVPASALGLTSSSQTSFSYRVMTEAAEDIGGAVDETPWIVFDAARPVVDVAHVGLGNSPFLPDGGALPINIERTAAPFNGLTPASTVGILLLHHHNLAGARAEVVNVQLDSTSTVPLRLLPPARTAGGGIALQWTSSAAQTYSVLASTNLAAGFPQVLASGIAGSPPFNRFTNLMSGAAGPRFYRILAE